MNKNIFSPVISTEDFISQPRHLKLPIRFPLTLCIVHKCVPSSDSSLLLITYVAYQSMEICIKFRNLLAKVEL